MHISPAALVPAHCWWPERPARRLPWSARVQRLAGHGTAPTDSRRATGAAYAGRALRTTGRRSQGLAPWPRNFGAVRHRNAVVRRPAAEDRRQRTTARSDRRRFIKPRLARANAALLNTWDRMDRWGSARQPPSSVIRTARSPIEVALAVSIDTGMSIDTGTLLTFTSHPGELPRETQLATRGGQDHLGTQASPPQA